MATNALSTPQKVVDFVQCTNATLEKAAALQQQKEATDAIVAKLIPDAVKECLDNERIDPAMQTKLAEALKDHGKCVELIIKLAKHRNTAETSQGHGVPAPGATKQASAGANYPGARSTGIKESDRKLFAGLGLPLPKE